MTFSRCIFSLTLVLISPFSTVAFASESSFQQVEKTIREVENHLSATVGVTVFDTQTNKLWDYKGDVLFPITSTFKTIACAKLLLDADSGKLSFKDSVTVTQQSLITYSPVTEKYVNKEITLDTACSAAMLTSDNTAANIILQAIGGPSEVTKFVRSIGDNTTRLDRFEPALNEGKPGDFRDTTSPNAMAKTLNALLFGSVISKSSQQQLKAWMMNNQVADDLLRSVLAKDWQIADRSGAGGYGSRSISAVVWPKSHSPIIISIYMTKTLASFNERNKALATIGQSIFKGCSIT